MPHINLSGALTVADCSYNVAFRFIGELHISCAVLRSRTTLTSTLFAAMITKAIRLTPPSSKGKTSYRHGRGRSWSEFKMLMYAIRAKKALP
jgi:hypothetical protein